jgi:hypothetical protein
MILVLHVLLTTVKPLMFHDFRFRKVIMPFMVGLCIPKLEVEGLI